MNIPTQKVAKIKKVVSSEYSGKLLYVMISGAHLYGFESKDSDIDFRGCYLIDTNKLMGLEPPDDFIKIEEGIDDIVLFELKKEIQQIAKGNCNIVEHLFADQIYTSDEYFALKKIVELNLNFNGLYHSYRGLAWDNYNLFCLKGMHTVKKFLYVFRGILAGIHVLHTHTIQPNLSKLLEGDEDRFWYEPIQQLIKLKRDGKEKDFLPDRMLPIYHKLVKDMLSIIDEVFEKTRPSEKVQIELDHTRKEDLDKFLKRVRKNYWKSNNGL